jgi:2'-5' RNA ligase
MSGIEKQAGKSGGDAIRTFVCIEIPEAVKERIAELQRELKQIEAQVSWVKPANIHLTVKFLGPVAPSRIAGIRQAVERAVRSCSPFEVEVAGTGCFPSPRNPKVLWVGLSHVPNQLLQLQQSVEDELARAGFPRESKRFSPHLTIGRVRSPRGASAVAERLIASAFDPLAFSATQVIVMRSDLNPSGSVYTHQALIQLGPQP